MVFGIKIVKIERCLMLSVVVDADVELLFDCVYVEKTKKKEKKNTHTHTKILALAQDFPSRLNSCLGCASLWINVK